MTAARGEVETIDMNDRSVENLMRQIREKIRGRRQGGSDAANDPAALSNVDMAGSQKIVSCLLSTGVEAVAKTHNTLASGISSFPRSRLKSWIRPWLVRVVRFYAYWQVQWNFVVAGVLGMFVNALDRIEARFMEVYRRVEDASKRLEYLEEGSQRLSVQLGQRLEEERRETRRLVDRMIVMEDDYENMETRLREAERKQEEAGRKLELLSKRFLEKQTWEPQR